MLIVPLKVSNHEATLVDEGTSNILKVQCTLLGHIHAFSLTKQFNTDQGMVTLSTEVSCVQCNMVFTPSWHGHDTLLITGLYSLLYC